jgi:hypothetical protein
MFSYSALLISVCGDRLSFFLLCSSFKPFFRSAQSSKIDRVVQCAFPILIIFSRRKIKMVRKTEMAWEMMMVRKTEMAWEMKWGGCMVEMEREEDGNS